MANRKVDPEKKRLPMVVTIQKNIKDKVKEKAEYNDLSLSSYIENLMIEDLNK